MLYPISEQLLLYNRSHQSFKPQGFVVHSTATPNATAQNEYKYFNSGNRSASVHYFVDWTQIIKCIPENEVAWHAGRTANSKFLSLEMCEPLNSVSKFQEVWNRTVWLVASACVRYGWNTEDNVWSHRGISNLYHETNHTDPISFLASYGKTWNQLLQAIDNEITNLKKSQSYTPSRSTNNNQGCEDMLDIAILLYGKEDYWAGTDVSDKNGNCAIFIRPADKSVPKDAMNSKKLYVIGGETVKHPNEILLSGSNKYGTAQAVYSYLQGK